MAHIRDRSSSKRLCHARSLHADPPSHPKLRNLFGFIHKTHVQQELCCSSHGAFESTEYPCMCIARVFAHCAGVSDPPMHIKQSVVYTYRKQYAAQYGSKQTNRDLAGQQAARPRHLPGTRWYPNKFGRGRRCTAPER